MPGTLRYADGSGDNAGSDFCFDADLACGALDRAQVAVGDPA